MKRVQQARMEGVVAQKSLGQNFLIDESVVEFILDQFSNDDVVLEIGPGLGVITLPLIEKVQEVWAVEKDPRLVRLLRQQILRHKRQDTRDNIIQGDYLRESYELKKHISKPYKIFGNIPYNITQPIVQDILFSDAAYAPAQALLMVQKEVAERLTGKRGSVGALTILVQLRSKSEIIRMVPRGAFSPQPKVDSALVRFTLGESSSQAHLLAQQGIDERTFMRLVTSCYAARRKMLRNTLAAFLQQPPACAEQVLESAGIDPHRRPEELGFEEWVHLANHTLCVSSKYCLIKE